MTKRKCFRFHTAWIWILAIALLSHSITRLHAQAVFGAIFGTVTDSTGAVVPNATVTITDTAKGISQTTQTNGDGYYRVDRLIPDPYSVKVSAQGFTAAETTGVAVAANGTPKVDITLQIAGASQQVLVTAAPPPLQSETAQVADRINQNTITTLPNLTRNFMQTQVFTPGTSQANFSNSLSQNPQGSASFSINGQNFGTQSWILDGTDNRDPVLGIIVINPTLDSVQGMQVLTQNYNAEFGGAVGGIITAETRSGTNDFHGDIFFYRHSDAQEARNPFTQFQPNPVTGNYLPSNVYGQFGGSVGGPIIKNRTFFFGDYQGTRQKSGQSLLLSVPTNQVRNTCLAATSGMCDLSEYLAGGARQIYDPVSGTPYVNNMIPTSKLSPQAIALLSQLPAPNVPGAGISNNYAISGFGPNNADAANIRLDDQTTQRLHTFARYSYVRYTLSGVNAFGTAGGVGLGPGNFAGTDWVQDQSIATGFDLALSANLATDFRFGLLKYQVDQNKPDIGTSPASDIGIPGLNTGAIDTSGNPDYLFTNGSLTNLGANITYNGTQICNCPLKQSEQEFQFVNNWTRTVGNHTIRFGGDVRYAMQLRSASDTNRTGVLNFTQTTTSQASTGAGGLDLATALMGYVTSFQRAADFNNQAASRQKRLAFYGQDTWRATQKLNLTYGIRWEMTFPETVNSAGNGGFTNLSTGYVQVAGIGGIDTNGGEKMDYTNISPRIGAAYQITPDTVLRAGAAIMYDAEGFYGTLFGTSLTANTPVYTTQDLVPSSTNGYAFTLTAGPPAVSAPAVPSNGLIPMENGFSYPTVRPLRITLPRVDQWNVSVQHQFGNHTTAEIAYVGNLAERTYPGSTFGFNTNQYRLPTTPAELANQAARRPYYNRFDNEGVICCNSDFTSGAPVAHANYNGLQTKLTERFDNGLQLFANYTWSKAMNNSGTYFYWDRNSTYARNDLNRTNVFNLYGTYELPFGKGKRFANSSNRWMNYAVGGWQLSGDSTWESGLPFTPTYAECGSEQDIDSNTSSGVLCRPNGSSSNFSMQAHALDASAHAVTYFTPVAPLTNEGSISGPFQRPGFGQFGNIGRNSFVGPREFIADASLLKNFAITERVNGQFQFQAFNVFNHPALGMPSEGGSNGPCIDCTTGTAGKITQLDPNINMRQLQFAVRLSF